MKTNRLFIAGLCFLAIGLFSCCEDDKQGGYADLTPDEHKGKLEEIGMNIANKIKPEDQENLVRTLDAIIEYSVGLEIEDNDAGHSAKSVVNFAKLMKSICSDNRLANVSALSRASNSELYSLARYSGVYEMKGGYKDEWGDFYYTWEKTGNTKEKLELRFPVNGKEAVILITKEGEEKRFDLYDDDDKTSHAVMVPEVAKGSIKYDDVEVLSAVCNMNVNNAEKTVVSDIKVKANNYEYVEHIDASSNKATTDLTFSIDGQKLINAKAWLNGKDMTNGDVYYDKEKVDAIQDLFGKGGVDIFIYSDKDAVKLVGEVSNVKRLVDKLDRLYDVDWEVENSMAHQQKIAEAYNEYINGEMYYTNSSDIIATFSMQAYADSDEYGTFFEIEPVITFKKDNSSYSFGSYFDDGISFEGLIDKIEQLEDDFDAYLEFN